MRTKINVTFGDFRTDAVGFDMGTITCKWNDRTVAKEFDCEIIDIHGIAKVAEMVTRLNGIELTEVLDENSPNLIYRGYGN